MSDTTINVQPTLTVSGTADFTISTGNCLKVNYAQPYVESETKYNGYIAEDTTGQTWDPFYVPFPATNSFSVSGSGTQITAIDEFTV